MPKKDFTAIVCVLDRSGSMAAVRDDVIGGFNHFLENQKKAPGEATLSLILFDHEYLEPVVAQPIDSVPPLDADAYVPRGSTALYDAIGRAITTLDETIKRTAREERPEKVVVVIMTDGHENASKEYERGQVHAMIDQRRSVQGWQFLFLTADEKALKDAREIGIAKSASMSYVQDGAGTRAAFAVSSEVLCSYRGGFVDGVSFEKPKPPAQTIAPDGIPSEEQHGEM